MSKPSPPSPSPGHPAPVAGQKAPTVKRRCWIVWVLVFVILLAVLVGCLPNILAMPFFRQRLLSRVFSRVNTRATVEDLSLSWFSPIAISNLELQPENTDRAALVVPQLAGDTPLWRMIFGRQLGQYRITRPELYIHFDREGTNISRLIRGMANMPLGSRGASLAIEDGRLLLQGESSPQPWPIEGINLNLTIIPAGESAAGVPTIRGENARLLNEMNLTPEMCNDLLKYITPPLFQATKTSGKVSLALDNFDWPLGKPETAKLAGKLTLYSVDVVPGPVAQLLNSVLQNRDAPLTLQIAKDDVVLFSMHDGRIYHENLNFRLAAMQVELLVHSRGSVGLDESLDWFIEFQFPSLEAADLTGHPLMKLLSQKPTIHITGTLNQPQWKPEGLALQVLQSGIELLQKRIEDRRQALQPVPAATKPAGQ